MEGAEEATQADYDATFIDQPAILDKYKAAGVIADGKYLSKIFKFICIMGFHFSKCFFNKPINYKNMI